MKTLQNSPSAQRAINFILNVEGGYSNHSADAGGETKFGISKRAYPNLDIKNLTPAQASDIYYQNYWLASRCQDLPESLALIMLDSAVNHGVNRAIRMLQYSVGAEVDGDFGDETYRLSNNNPLQKSIQRFFIHRAAFYSNLVAGKPSQKVFLKGWFNRLEKLADELHSSNRA